MTSGKCLHFDISVRELDSDFCELHNYDRERARGTHFPRTMGLMMKMHVTVTPQSAPPDVGHVCWRRRKLKPQRSADPNMAIGWGFPWKFVEKTHRFPTVDGWVVTMGCGLNLNSIDSLWWKFQWIWTIVCRLIIDYFEELVKKTIKYNLNVVWFFFGVLLTRNLNRTWLK